MTRLFVYAFLGASCALAAEAPPAPAPQAQSQDAQYLLGPGDQIRIWSLGMEEISDKPIRIDPSGDLDLPTVGKVHAGGLTLTQLKAELADRFTSLVRQPQVSVEVVEYGSQPVSVMGAVAKPGIVQLEGRKTLSEVLSLAGGLTPNAGPRITISRPLKDGPIPLLDAKTDATHAYSVAEVSVKDLLSGAHPGSNILISPRDAITVPPAEMVYVVGDVKKPGPVPLDRDGVTILQALAMAEGYGPMPKPQASKIVRMVPGSAQRMEIPVDLSKMLAGKTEDVGLRPNDILVIPASTPKRAAARALEAMVQTATGVVIWRLP